MNPIFIMIKPAKNPFNKLFFIFFFLLLNKSGSLISFTYPSSISLNINNYFIVEQKGIYVYDSEFKNIIKSYPFNEAE